PGVQTCALPIFLEPAASEAAVATAVERFGGLDIAFLNAGIAGGGGVGDDFDLAAYRRAMGVNLDGVFFGVHAALPALRARGGGNIIATASMAALTATPFDPVYGANRSEEHTSELQSRENLV